MSSFLMIRRALLWTNAKLLPSSSGFNFANAIPLGTPSILGPYLNQTRCYPARKGTIEKRKKLQRARKLKQLAKQAEELANAGPRFASKVKVTTRERTDMYNLTREPVDDVWLRDHNKRKIYSISEVIEMHRELHHPSMLDLPDAPLYLLLELNMSLEKKNKFLDEFSKIVPNPHYFSSGINRTIMAFCKNEQGQADAMAAGAALTGGISLVKQVQSGEVVPSDFDYVVAHTDMVNDITSIRGILKKRYPTPARGALGVDMRTLVERFKMGIEYAVEKDSIQHDFGFMEVNVGPLSMPAEHLEANIGAIVQDVCTHRSPTLGPFINIAILLCPPSKEKLAIDVSKYTPKQKSDDDDEDLEAIEQ